jgi:hypothetical protein
MVSFVRPASARNARWGRFFARIYLEYLERNSEEAA